ncbi:hypothetical protein DCC79_04515 [bacterium]|nr:MAG: hypothetical protein DCC79_04515 [bacterium]
MSDPPIPPMPLNRSGLRPAWDAAMRFGRSDRGFACALAALVLAIYLPTWRYGLIWDDPRWYQQGAGQSLRDLLGGLETYQFYRPLAIWLNRQLVSPAGVVNVRLAHVIQIGAHAAAALGVWRVFAQAGFTPRHARWAAVLFAACPLSYQPVAWPASQQPLTVMWVVAALVAAGRWQRSGRRAWGAASLACYAAALLFQEVAVALVGLFWLAAWTGPATGWRRRWWPIGHTVLAAAYMVAWLGAPRSQGVTGEGWELEVLAYALQAAVFPAARLAAAAWPDVALHPVALLAAGFAALGLVSAAGAWRASGPRAVLWAGAWVVLGALPVWVGLSWDYVSVGERLLYPATPGIAALWGGWAACAAAPGASRGRRWAARGVLAVVLAVSLHQLWVVARLYRAGTGHMAAAEARLTAAGPGARLVFVNFPDRIEIRPPLYPLGFWGLTLAPVVQDLSDYGRAMGGRSAADRSIAAFVVGAADRDRWLYRVDMRGVNVQAAERFPPALWPETVLLTDYLPGGRLGLREVGGLRAAGRRTEAEGADAAVFGGTVRLREATLDGNDLRLVWRTAAPLGPDDTVFVHVYDAGGALVGDADGDALAALWPATAWTPAMEVVDVRRLAVPAAPGRYDVRVGWYNRATGARLAARSPAGARFPDDAVPVAAFARR